MKLKASYLQIRLSFIFGLCLSITVAGVLGVTLYYSYKNADSLIENGAKVASKHARNELLLKTKEISFELRSQLNSALDTARSLANVLSGIKDKNVNLRMDRKRINATLKSTLAKNRKFIGIGSVWEPNALDNLDELYKKSEGHDKTGRFIPYWSRDPSGNIVLAPVEGYENAELDENGIQIGAFYLTPRSTHKECIIDPYMYSVQGEKIWMTTGTVPIMAEDTFYGVVGIDIKLDSIQKFVVQSNKSLFDGAGSIIIVSNNGIIAAHSTDDKLAGKHLKTIEPDHWEKDIQLIHSGEESLGRQETMMKVMTPVMIGESQTPWAVMILVPEIKVTEDVNILNADMHKQIKSSIIAGLEMGTGIAVAALLIIWGVAGKIARPLNHSINSLEENYSRVAAASSQMASAGQSLAEGASHQAASIEETSASLEEMASMTHRNAANAAEANSIAKASSQTFSQADVLMDQLTEGMRSISATSRETSNIINTIDNIAFQTNLLALNAAVEAARAGEAGAGFAVVAEEVRNLAIRSAEAAKGTAGLIEKSIKTIEEGESLNQKTNEAFSASKDHIRKISELAAEIAAASNEQSQGIEQISRAVADMDKITQQNAANAQETASSSEELFSQSEMMKQTVAQLKKVVKGNGSIQNRNLSSGSAQPVRREMHQALPKKTSAEKLKAASDRNKLSMPDRSLLSQSSDDPELF